MARCRSRRIDCRGLMARRGRQRGIFRRGKQKNRNLPHNVTCREFSPSHGKCFSLELIKQQSPTVQIRRSTNHLTVRSCDKEREGGTVLSEPRKLQMSQYERTNSSTRRKCWQIRPNMADLPSAIHGRSALNLPLQAWAAALNQTVMACVAMVVSIRRC